MDMAVIFDMDGVIVDTNPYHRFAWSAFLREHGVEPDNEMFGSLIFGTTGDQALKKLLGAGYTDSAIDGFVKDIDAVFCRCVREDQELEPVKGLIILLERLQFMGIGIAMATSAPDENIDLILDKFALRKYFKVIVGKKDISKGKPHPEVYLKVLDRMQLTSKQCIVFEDSLSGIQSALRAGIGVIGITSYHKAATLEKAGVLMAVDDFTAITPEKLMAIVQHQQVNNSGVTS